MGLWWYLARARFRFWLRELRGRGAAEREREHAFFAAVDPVIATVTAELDPWAAYDGAYSICAVAEEWEHRVLVASGVWLQWIHFTDCFEVAQPHGMADLARVRDGMATVAREWLAIGPDERRGYLKRVRHNSLWWNWLLGQDDAPAPCSPSAARERWWHHTSTPR